MLVDLSQQYVTTGEAAAFMRYANERPIVRMIHAGKIPDVVQRPDGRYLIPADWIKRNLPNAGNSTNGHD